MAKKEKKCKSCGKVVKKLFDGKCSFCNEFGEPEHKEPKIEKIKLTEKEKKTDREIDIWIDDIISLRNDKRWKSFEEAVHFLMGKYNERLFDADFVKLDAVEKDKQHTAIVEVRNILSKLLTLPAELEKNQIRRWVEAQELLLKTKI